MIRFCNVALFRALAPGWVVGVLLFLLNSPVAAQSLRDPTLPPSVLGLSSVGSGEKSVSSASSAMTIIVRNGRPHLVMGTRLYTQGEKLGQARIERISETEVWLREGGVLRKLPQFQGIERRAVAPLGCASYSFEKLSPVVPCAGVQP